MRQVERQVMLAVIDQRWRAHLYEMDYLREGINLRAMGQKDPLVEWQREGFDMFGQMMHGIWQDFIKYVMHVEVQVTRPPVAGAPPSATGAPADAPATGRRDGRPRRGAGRRRPAQRAVLVARRRPAPAAARPTWPPPPGPRPRPPAASRRRCRQRPAAARRPPATQSNTPVVKSEWDRTPRNAPCPCGSGKKFKLCHGRS